MSQLPPFLLGINVCDRNENGSQLMACNTNVAVYGVKYTLLFSFLVAGIMQTTVASKIYKLCSVFINYIFTFFGKLTP